MNQLMILIKIEGAGFATFDSFRDYSRRRGDRRNSFDTCTSAMRKNGDIGQRKLTLQRLLQVQEPSPKRRHQTHFYTPA